VPTGRHDRPRPSSLEPYQNPPATSEAAETGHCQCQPILHGGFLIVTNRSAAEGDLRPGPVNTCLSRPEPSRVDPSPTAKAGLRNYPCRPLSRGRTLPPLTEGVRHRPRPSGRASSTMRSCRRLCLVKARADYTPLSRPRCSPYWDRSWRGRRECSPGAPPSTDSVFRSIRIRSPC
jgi:hypothetical protein